MLLPTSIKYKNKVERVPGICWGSQRRKLWQTLVPIYLYGVWLLALNYRNPMPPEHPSAWNTQPPGLEHPYPWNSHPPGTSIL